MDSSTTDGTKENIEGSNTNPENKVPLAAFVATVAQQQIAREREKLEAELTAKLEEQFMAKYAQLMKAGSENLASQESSRKRDHAPSSEEDEPPAKKHSLRKQDDAASVKKSRLQTTQTKTNTKTNNKEGAQKNQDGDEEDEHEESEYDQDDAISLPDDGINEELLKLLGGGGPSDTTPDEEEETDFFVLHKEITDKLQEALKKDDVSEAIAPELADLLKKIWTQKVGNSNHQLVY